MISDKHKSLKYRL